ncbi:MAG: sigma-70 family RNA polymerase sigma factor [Bacteroidales bacterium]|jgi:RNA polymerase sigma-70 factor (ECF subfamily)|nr:sigma-70 family RNA polymerase sigma factor [Bacteroidales bacterium]
MVNANSKKQILEEALQYEQLLKTVAFRLTSDNELSKDLVQDTYLKVCQNIDKFQENTNLKAWMLTIMKNNFFNYHRKMQRRKGIWELNDNILNDYIDISLSCDDADVHIYEKEINDQIADKKEEQRKPFEMFLDGYKYQEIADEMNLSLGTVKSRIFFTRKKLMNDLQDYISHQQNVIND